MEDSAARPHLATFRKFTGRLPQSWPEFQRQRQARLAQQERNGIAAEKVAENILEDFFTIVLDWALSDLNNQLQYADIVLTTRGIKRLLVEVKRPGSLRWDQPSLEQALSQARRYADEQRVRSIAVSDGTLFYAVDIVNGGLQPRARLLLDTPTYSPNTWWISVDGIYRQPVTDLDEPGTEVSRQQAEQVCAGVVETPTGEILLHPKHKRPADCFAYVGDASKPATWKLPCRNANGSVDEKHLSGAVRAAVANYRGTQLKSVPDSAMDDVLVRLGKAAAEARKLPGQTSAPIATYQELYNVLEQKGLLEKVLAK